jgi:hypothetical protein
MVAELARRVRRIVSMVCKVATSHRGVAVAHHGCFTTRAVVFAPLSFEGHCIFFESHIAK